ncbi:MAG TPA: adenylosuccinate lyase [Myxococcales bacterium]|jgi:adenylosuccinate lyase
MSLTAPRDALGPLDGRYRDRLEPVAACFSELALMRARCEVELDYLLALDETGLLPKLEPAERTAVDALRQVFGHEDYERIKALEKDTRHDVKACELFLREKLALRHPNHLHFGLTSEDVNNLAYTSMLEAYRSREQLPQLDRLLDRLAALAERFKAVPFPTRTHGQRATPSTLGKELGVFLWRLVRLRRKLAAHRFYGKLGGATGNHAAMIAVFPAFDWLGFARRFVEERRGLAFNLATTQIEDHDSWAEYFNLTRQVNNVLLDLDQDVWMYLSLGLLREETVKGEVGSSTMPHKVNPIRFENSEGNLSLANALLVELSNKLCRSRMQRDLSDSTVERNMGVALGHGHLAAGETLAGLERLGVDEARCRAELEASPELLAEPMQTILRAAGLVGDPYELLKVATRGQTVTRAGLDVLVDSLNVDAAVKTRLRALRVTEYVGASQRICEEVVAEARKELGR